MSQDNTGQAQLAETSTQETKTFIRQVRTKTRRKYAPEDKIRIVLEGFRREVTVSDLCRREGIKPGIFYSWTKEFMEAGKERLTRDCWQPTKVSHFRWLPTMPSLYTFTTGQTMTRLVYTASKQPHLDRSTARRHAKQMGGPEAGKSGYMARLCGGGENCPYTFEPSVPSFLNEE